MKKISLFGDEKESTTLDLCYVAKCYEEGRIDEGRTILYKNIRAVIPKWCMSKIMDRRGTQKYVDDDRDSINFMFQRIDDIFVNKIKIEFTCGEIISYIKQACMFAMKRLDREYAHLQYKFDNVGNTNHLNMAMEDGFAVFYGGESYEYKPQGEMYGDDFDPQEYTEHNMLNDMFAEVFINLTEKEQKVASLLQAGYTGPEIGRMLGVTRQAINKTKNLIRDILDAKVNSYKSNHKRSIR